MPLDNHCVNLEGPSIHLFSKNNTRTDIYGQPGHMSARLQELQPLLTVNIRVTVPCSGLCVILDFYCVPLKTTALE